VAANIFVAGLPSGASTSSRRSSTRDAGHRQHGLNSSAPDVYYRTDLGIDRLEFVRGGVSNLFAVGASAGDHFIDKTGRDTADGASPTRALDTTASAPTLRPAPGSPTAFFTRCQLLSLR